SSTFEVSPAGEIVPGPRPRETHRLGLGLLQNLHLRGVVGELALAPGEDHPLVAGELDEPAAAREADVADDVARHGVAVADRELPRERPGQPPRFQASLLVI